MRLAIPVLLAALLALCPTLGRAAAPVLLVDQGHGQRFLIEQEGELHLSGLAAIFRGAGFEVRSAAGKLTPEALSGVDALVTSGLFASYDRQELQAILGFLERGGTLSVMLHVAPTYQNLLDALGVLSSPGALQEEENVIGGKPSDFRVKNLRPHPLTEGLDQFSLYGAWAVMDNGKDARTLAFTSRQSWIDADRNRQRGAAEPLHAYGVLVAGTHGKGRFAVFGDDAVFQNRFLDADNRKLASNLARWLLGGQSI